MALEHSSMNWRAIGVGVGGMDVGVAVGGAGVCVGIGVSVGVGGAGIGVAVGAVVGASAGVAAGAVVAVGAGVCVSAGAVVAVGSAAVVATGAVVGVGAGVGEHAISSETATMDIAANSARLVIILVARLDIDLLVRLCSPAVGQPHSLADEQRALGKRIYAGAIRASQAARKRTSPQPHYCAVRGAYGARGVVARLRARLEIGVGFAAAALAYDLYALGCGYGFG